jgi:hypothetical protein
MGAVTYPNAMVADFVNEKMIPVQLAYDAKPEAHDYNVTWTPTLIVLDSKGKEHQRFVGFLSPEEIIPALMLGIGKTYFDGKNFKKALSTFEEIVKNFPKSINTPEAIYLRGVCGYMTTHTAEPLKKAHEKIKAEFPNSEWTMRSDPYSYL